MNGWALFLNRVIEFGGGHRCAAYAITAGLCAKINDRHANAGGCGVEDFVRVGESCCEGIHKAVAVIGWVEADFAAHGWDTKTVAVSTDTGNNTVDQLPGLRVVRFTKGQGIHRRNRACAHCEDITQNAANACCSTLIGFDVAGVVVAFHFEDDRLAVTNVDHTCILARTTNHLWAFCGKSAKPFLR